MDKINSYVLAINPNISEKVPDLEPLEVLKFYSYVNGIKLDLDSQKGHEPVSILLEDFPPFKGIQIYLKEGTDMPEELKKDLEKYLWFFSF
jgi:hypothetical protein